MSFTYVDPNNFKNKAYFLRADDPNVPAGWTLVSGSDGSTDNQPQNYMPGVYSGGYPAYGTVDAQGTYGAPGTIR